MIPTPIECITEVLPTITYEKYKILIENQTTFINNHKNTLFRKVRQFKLQYDKDHLPENVKKRCCDFYLLERKSKEYIENELRKNMSRNIFSFSLYLVIFRRIINK